MDNEFCFMAWPGDILLVRFERSTDGMNARNKITIFAKLIQHGIPHSGHNLHVHRHVGGIGNFNPDDRVL